MTDEEYDAAAAYWLDKDKESKAMPEEELEKRIRDFLTENKVCALASGGGETIRCTPLEYAFHDDAVWIFTEGGLKFRGLKEDPHAALAIYKADPSFGGLAGMQLTGRIEIPDPFGEEYIKAAEYKKIPLDMLRKLPSPMHLLKFIPDTITYLNSSFKEEGYGSRQTWKR